VRESESQLLWSKSLQKAVGQLWGLAILPLVLLILGTAYFFFWIYAALYIFSVQKITPAQTLPASLQHTLGVTAFYDRVFDETWRKAAYLHVFHLFWNTQAIIYLGYFVLSGAIADWYFTYPDKRGNKIRGNGDDELPSNPVYAAVFRTLRYNLGTVLVGSFLLAILQFFRYFLKLVQAKCTLAGGAGNALQKTCFQITSCMMKFVECCVDQVNKNGFIYSSIYGEPFFASSCAAFQVIWRNLGRVAAVELISDFLVITGKFSVAFVTTGAAAWYFQYNQSIRDNMSSMFFPCVFIFVISYMASSVFMVLYETAIDTVFFCFLVDEECNVGKRMYASDNLRKIVDTQRDESEQLAKRQKSVHSLGIQDRYERKKTPGKKGRKAKRAVELERSESDSYDAPPAPKGRKHQRHYSEEV